MGETDCLCETARLAPLGHYRSTMAVYPEKKCSVPFAIVISLVLSMNRKKMN